MAGTPPHRHVEILSDVTHAVVAGELRSYGDAPSIYAPCALAFNASASALAQADASRAAETAIGTTTMAARGSIGRLLAERVGPDAYVAESVYSGEVLFLAAPSTVGVSTGILIEAGRATVSAPR